QDHVAAGPAHQEQRAAVAHVGDQAGHGDEGRRRHPVGRGGHAVGDRVNAAAGNVELTGGTGARPDGDADVEGERGADDQIGQCLQFHLLRLPSVFVYVELAVDLAHLLRVIEDQRDEDVDRTLLCEPEAQRVTADLDG